MSNVENKNEQLTVEEEGCSLESTCEMDTSKKLSEEKNAELMKHGLDSLDDLL